MPDLRPNPRERRHTPRYSLQEPARVELGSWRELVELYTKDISHNGVFIQTSTPPQVRSEVAVHLLLPGGAGTIRFRGEVVHVITPEQAGASAVPGFGVQFMGLTDRDRQILRSIVAQAKAAAQTPEAIGLAVRRLVKAQAPSPPKQEDVAPQFARQRLRAVFDSLVACSDAEVLGLDESATLEQIGAAFERLARHWRPGPDRRRSDSEEAKLVRGIYMRIEQAHRRLCTQATTLAERPSLSQSPAMPSIPRASNYPCDKEQHRRLLTQAIDLLRSKRYRDSMEVLSRARRLRPDHIHTSVLLCFARARQALVDRDVPQARAHYEEALRLDPTNGHAQKELLILSAMMGSLGTHSAAGMA